MNKLRTVKWLASLLFVGCVIGQVVFVMQAEPVHTQAVPDDEAAPRESWGTLTGQFVFDGQPPERRRIHAIKDVEVCGQAPIFDESLLVEPTTHGIANIVIYTKTVPRLHPALSKPRTDDLLMQSKGCVFTPHLLVARVGQKLAFKSDDRAPCKFNFSPLLHKQIISPLIQAGDQKTPIEEVFSPCLASCNIHPWEKAWLVAVDNPYFAVTDKQGRFTIRDLPAGEALTFTVWHEVSNRLKVGQEDGGRSIARSSRDKAGITVTLIPEQVSDLGTIFVPAAQLLPKD